MGIPPSGVAKDLSISGCDVNIEQMVDVTMKSICYPWKPAGFFLHLGEKPCKDPLNVFPRSALNPPSEPPSWLSRGFSRDKNTKRNTYDWEHLMFVFDFRGMGSVTVCEITNRSYSRGKLPSYLI